jgi:L-2-hydroxyglutarate oxidase LhgO
MFKIDAVVVGAGVIGLAIARMLARSGIEVFVLEKEAGIGTAISSRNSEVIHAGLYYRTGSLKARLCVEGRRALYQYCAERNVPHRRCGKLIVATCESEDSYLDSLREKAEANGVEEVERIGQARLRSLEPALRGTSALFSPTTGIIDSHSLMMAYQADIEADGGMLCFRTPVLKATFAGDTILLRTGGTEPAELEAHLVVNAAGLMPGTSQDVCRDLMRRPSHRNTSLRAATSA